jgi:hypothetical protein
VGRAANIDLSLRLLLCILIVARATAQSHN